MNDSHLSGDEAWLSWDLAGLSVTHVHQSAVIRIDLWTPQRALQVEYRAPFVLRTRKGNEIAVSTRELTIDSARSIMSLLDAYAIELRISSRSRCEFETTVGAVVIESYPDIRSWECWGSGALESATMTAGIDGDQPTGWFKT